MMNKLSKSFSFFCLLYVVLSSINHLNAAGSNNPASLTVEITMEKTSLVVGEPGYVHVILKNTGNTAINVPRILEWQSGKLRLHIVDPGGKSTAFSPLFYADTSIPTQRLAPGQAMNQYLPVFFGSAGWSFSQPGSYRLQLTYQDDSIRSEPLNSNVLAMSVVNETGSSELLVNDSKASFAAGKFIFWQQGDHLNDGIALINRMLEKQPSTLLANYARFALASNLSRGFRNYAIGKYREADCGKALNLFDQVSADDLPVYLQIKMRTRIEGCRKT